MKALEYMAGRYTMSLTGTDRSVEVGDVSQDGATWRKFFEMTLQRAPR